VPPRRFVRLLGPPIARACVSRASDDWIRVSETTEGLDISVDTTRTGTLRGSVELKGPTGEGVIAINVELLPQAAQTSPTRRPSTSAHKKGMAPAIPVGQPEGRSAATGREKAQPAEREAVKREAAERGGHDGVKAIEPQAMESPSARTWTVRESSTAPQPTTPAASSATRPPTRTGTVFGDRWPLFAGSLAVAGTAFAVAGLFPTYMTGTCEVCTSPYSVSISVSQMSSGWWLFVVVTAALYLTAGICTLIPRTRSLFGPGLLLATVAASTSALVYNVSHLKKGYGAYDVPQDSVSYGAGFWLQLLSNLSLVLAACVAGLALARAARVRPVQQPPRNALVWVVVLLGVAGALALVLQNLSWATVHAIQKPVEVTSFSVAVWALVMPAWAAVAVPRRLGVALLAGWICVGAAFFVYYYLFFHSFLETSFGGRGPVAVFGVTLLALSAVAVPFGRAEADAMPTRMT
jgi:hypothetical protein